MHYGHIASCFDDTDNLEHVCLLRKSLYDLKQSMIEDVVLEIARFFWRMKFKESFYDSSLFILKLVYVSIHLG